MARATARCAGSESAPSLMPGRHEAPEHVLLGLDLVERDRLAVGHDRAAGRGR